MIMGGRVDTQVFLGGSVKFVGPTVGDFLGPGRTLPEKMVRPPWVKGLDWSHRMPSFSEYVGVSKNRDTPKWMVYNGKPY